MTLVQLVPGFFYLRRALTPESSLWQNGKMYKSVARINYEPGDILEYQTKETRRTRQGLVISVFPPAGDLTALLVLPLVRTSPLRQPIALKYWNEAGLDEPVWISFASVMVLPFEIVCSVGRLHELDLQNLQPLFQTKKQEAVPQRYTHLTTIT